MGSTLASLRTLVRQRADQENSQFVTDEELNNYINSSYRELYELLVNRYEDYFLSRSTAIVASGNVIPLPQDFFKLRGVDYRLGSSEDEWATVYKYNYQERNVGQRPLVKMAWGSPNVRYRVLGQNIELLPAAQASGTYRINYIPKCVPMVEGVLARLNTGAVLLTAKDVYKDSNVISLTLTGGGTAGSEVVSVSATAITVQIQNGVTTAQQLLTALNSSSSASTIVSTTLATTNPGLTVNTAPQSFLTGGIVQVDMDENSSVWDEYVVIDTAIKCLTKEESDTTSLKYDKAQMKQRIEENARNRDAGLPERVADVSSNFDEDWFFRRLF